MNDVTITVEESDEVVIITYDMPDFRHISSLYPEQYAALREHFAAEHDAALVAERDAARGSAAAYEATANAAVRELEAVREQLEAAKATYGESARLTQHAFEQLAAAESVIEKATSALEDVEPHEYVHGPDPRRDNAYRILSGYPVSSAHPERDAEKWDEGWQQGFRDYQRAELDDGYMVITPTPCPYRVTPTEEAKR